MNTAPKLKLFIVGFNSLFEMLEALNKKMQDDLAKL